MLKFHFGPLPLASFRLGLRTVDTAGDPILAPDPKTPPRLDLLQPAERGYLLLSQPLPEGTPRISVVGWALCYVAKRYNRQLIDLSMGYSAYLQTLSSKTRATLNRKARRFADLSGGHQFRSYAKPEEMAAFYSAARHISALTYQEKLYAAGLPDSAQFRESMLARAETDRVRGYVLFAGDKPISYLYCPIENGRMQYAYLGFDPSFASHSPGTVLQWLALQHIFQENKFRTFDFLEGEGPSKRMFATTTVYCGDVFYFRNDIINNMIVYSHAFLEDLGQTAVALSKKVGVYTKLRRKLRGQ